MRLIVRWAGHLAAWILLVPVVGFLASADAADSSSRLAPGATAVQAAADPRSAQAATSPDQESPVAQARGLLERIQGALSGEERGPLPDDAQLENAVAALRSYLDAHPHDVEALILAARIGWFTALQTPNIYAPGDKTQDPSAEYEPVHELLDRALKLDPRNAEANYWKARLYGVVVPEVSGGVMDYRPLDLARAIHFARQAVDLMPLQAHYREALAEYLLQDQQPTEAMKVLKDVRGGRHPVFLLLSDWESFSLPQGAVFDSMTSEGLAQISQANGTLADYAHLRVRAYVVPMAAAEVEAFFRQRDPDFQLGKPKIDAGEGKTQLARYLQFLRRTETGWVRERSEPENPSGMALMLMEIREPDEELRNQLPVAVGDVFCNLVLMNFREVVP